MPSVFLSYSQNDLEPALLIQQELNSRGITVWRDQERLRTGQRWPKALGEAIAESDALLLLWSQEAANSTFVELEWTTALALKIEILPCLLDATPLPASLAAFQTISPTAVSEAAEKIVRALKQDESSPDLQASKKQVIEQLAGIRATKATEVLRELRAIHGSVYQAGRDIYIGSPAPSKPALDKWQAWLAIIASILTATTLALALWHNYAPDPVTIKTQDTQKNANVEQSFSGSAWTAGNEPLPGVKVSLLLDGKLLGSTITDRLGRFTFQVRAAPDTEITLIAQKDGFATEKRCANVPNTNFNFTMSGPSQ